MGNLGYFFSYLVDPDSADDLFHDFVLFMVIIILLIYLSDPIDMLEKIPWFWYFVAIAVAVSIIHIIVWWWKWRKENERRAT